MHALQIWKGEVHYARMQVHVLLYYIGGSQCSIVPTYVLVYLEVLCMCTVLYSTLIFITIKIKIYPPDIWTN